MGNYYVAGSGSSPVTLTTGDLEIGAVELKNADTDDRAAVKTASTAADTDKALVVADPNVDAKLPAIGRAAAAASVTVALSTEDAAKQPALGSAADAASVPVTQSAEDKAVLAAMSAKLPASVGAKAAAASLSVTQSTEDAAKVPALGAAASAAAVPVVLATDDSQIYRIDPTVAAVDQEAIGTSSASVVGLAVGTKYVAYSDVPCFIKVAGDAVAAALTDVYLRVGDRIEWTPTADDTDDGIAVIASVAGGTLYVQACQ